MVKITPFGWYWIVWVVLGFGIPETYGILRNVKDTLSWQFWGLEHLDFGHPFDFAEWTPVHYTVGIVLLIFFLWLFIHLTFGLVR